MVQLMDFQLVPLKECLMDAELAYHWGSLSALSLIIAATHR